jgi:hypothetical protein
MPIDDERKRLIRDRIRGDFALANPRGSIPRPSRS